MDLFTIFLWGVGVAIVIRLIQGRRRPAIPRRRGSITVAMAKVLFSPTLILSAAFAIPMLVGGLWKVFFPPAQPAIPIWVWILLGIVVLVVIKSMSRPQYPYPGAY